MNAGFFFIGVHSFVTNELCALSVAQGISIARFALIALVMLAGAGLSFQSALNTRLREAVASPILAAAVSFGVGFALLLIVMLSGVLGGRGAGVSGLKAAPPWAFAGGALGAFFVLLATLAVPRVGVAVTIASAICGQLAASLLLDHMGWLGVSRTPLSPLRLVGVLLLLAGVWLVQRK